MRSLVVNDTYSRAEVQELFAPGTPFIPQAGTWGLHGVVAIPNRPGDWVFFVTFGRQQGDHVFEEGITDDGVLTWQSQPRQSLKDAAVREWIAHDEDRNTIYLFLREKDRAPYRYLGRLKYLSHDNQRERPVHFQWQIVDDVPVVAPVQSAAGTLPAVTLSPEPAPPPSTRQGQSSNTFKTRKAPNYALKEARDRGLGLAGERSVLDYEIARLTKAGRTDLAQKVVHVSVVEGDGAGYDIRSFETNGQELFIEVKTTRGPKTTDFFISSNELAFASQHAGTFALYRVYDFDDTHATGHVFVLRSPLDQQVRLEPTQYRASL